MGEGRAVTRRCGSGEGLWLLMAAYTRCPSVLLPLAPPLPTECAQQDAGVSRLLSGAVLGLSRQPPPAFLLPHFGGVSSFPILFIYDYAVILGFYRAEQELG